MKKIKFGAASFWTILMGFISPIWLGSTYMDIIGYGKGYSYDMGSEADIAVFFGFIMLMIWLVAVIPVIIWLCYKCYTFNRKIVLMPVVVFILCFIVGILVIGMDEFLKIFDYPFSALYH